MSSLELPERTAAGAPARSRSRVWSVSAVNTHRLLVALWAVGFAAVAALRNSVFLTQRYDLGNMTQAVWSTAHGRLFEVTEVGGQQVSRLGIHVDPILALFVPLWWLWSSPVVLLVGQAVALALGSFPVFWLARKHLGSESAALKLSIAYLLYPAVGWNALHEFHAVALSVPFLLLAIWFLDEGRLLPFAGAAVLAAACQEQIGLVICALGIWYAVKARRIRVGAGIAAAGFAWSAIALLVVVPHFASGSPFFGRYQGVGGSATGIVRTLATDPLRVLSALATPFDLIALAFLAIPLLGLWLGSSISLVAVPQFALVMLSDRVADLDYRYQTVLPVVPFLVAGTTMTLARYRPELRKPLGYLLFGSVAAAFVLGPFGAVRSPLPDRTHTAAERAAVALVPQGARVAATNKLGGHLWTRRYIYVFPVVKKADWIVADARDYWLPSLATLRRRRGIQVGVRDLYPQQELMLRLLSKLRRSPAWKTVLARDGVYVFRRA